ncbi:MAG: DUF2953 domain-containing protein [Oscillospiraceae bacterium]|jgi:hypothetical protein|nr:DUF2953 domain-containing protein [Oscillospiraceae bacterium]
MISFEDSLYLKIGFLFFRYELVSKKAKKEKLKKGKKISKKKKTNFERIKKENIGKLIVFIKKMIHSIINGTSEIWSRVFFDELNLKFIVGGDDSAEIGILYGKICTTIYPLLQILFKNKKMKNFKIRIYPDFNAKQSKLKFQTKIRVRLGTILFIIFKQVIYGIITYITFKKSQKNRAISDVKLKNKR